MESLLVGTCCSLVEPGIVISAFVITSIVVFALVFYALVTKTDFTGCGPYLYGVLILMIVIGFFQIFGLFRSNIYSYIGVGYFRVILNCRQLYSLSI